MAYKGYKGYGTPESVARQREIAQALAMNLGRAPRNIGEGLNAIGQALMVRGHRKRADKAEEAGLERRAANSEKALAMLFGAGRGGYTPMAGAPQDVSPDVVAALTPQGTNKEPWSPEVAERAIDKAGTNPEQSEFIAQMWPLAQEAAKATGLDPRLIMGQAALETGWGKSAPGNNYFGIKGHGAENARPLGTYEYREGEKVAETAPFRFYGDPAESVQDYVHFLETNPRYQPMLEAEGLGGQLRALGESGYATDPNYAGKVAQIAYGLDVPGQTYGMEGGQPPQGGPQMAQAGGGVPPQPAGLDPAKIQVLMQLYNEPWTSEADKQLIGAYLEQQLEAMAPMSRGERAKLDLNERQFGFERQKWGDEHGLDRERLELEREKARSTGDLTEYDRYVEQEMQAGREPLGFLEYQTALKMAGRSETNVNVDTGSDMPQVGTIPQGFELQQTETGWQMAPIPGGPAETEQQQAEEAKKAKRAQEVLEGQVVLQNIDKVLDDPNLDWSVGVIGALSKSIPGTPAHDLAATLDNLKAIIGFKKLQSIRDSSPTGGAVGQVSNLENQLMQASYGSLLQSQSPDQFKENMNRVRNIFLDIVHGAGKGPKRTDWRGTPWSQTPHARLLAETQGVELPEEGAAPADRIPTYNPATGEFE